MTQETFEGTGIATPPEIRLTKRQRSALDLIARAPVSSSDLGFALNGRGRPLPYDESNGRSVGDALRKKGLVRFSRKHDVWLLVDAPDPSPPSSQTDEIPY